MTELKTSFSESDIRPEDLMEQQKRFYENDIRRLLLNKDSFVKVNCPACNQDRTEFAFEKYQMRFLNCLECSTVYCSPRPTPAHLDDYYGNSENYAFWNTHIFPASAEVRREKIFKPRVELVRKLVEKHSQKRQVLVEVGPGSGLFLEELTKTNLFEFVVGVEPTPELAQTLRDKGLNVVQKPIEAVLEAELVGNKQSVDVIVSFEVIEHLFAPAEFIDKCAKLLKPGGLLLLTCPNSQGFDIATLGPLSSAVDTEHLNLFNPQSLGKLIEKHGFKIVQTQTPGRLDAEMVRNKILSGEYKPDSLLQTVLIDNWETCGTAFQEFLTKYKLSSNMLVAAVKC